ncbi:hypothetical protein [Sphingobacterium psychroaquaticum]|uniref:Uncharacterized protein n=1 Tax=Sphingobacterium psychroaquaticum TaxID=561061 RepID=A0A1X7JX00_9SPHI|nr:hypothetical protein [Sphingobacterium psychroaquaticum]SMG32625.1 hypothetical protein SAMN05660862_2274 [Sphingobacterium psychroaquaticum]
MNLKIPVYVFFVTLLFFSCSKDTIVVKDSFSIKEAKTFYNADLHNKGKNALFERFNLVVDWSNYVQASDSSLTVYARQEPLDGSMRIVGHFELSFSKDYKGKTSGMIKYVLPELYNGAGGYIAYNFQGTLVPPRGNILNRTKEVALMTKDTQSYYRQVLFAVKKICPAKLYFDKNTCMCVDAGLISGLDVTPAYWLVQYADSGMPEYFPAPLDGTGGMNPDIIAFPDYNWTGDPFFDPHTVANPDYNPGGGGSGGGGSGSGGSGEGGEGEGGDGSGGSSSSNASNHMAVAPVSSIDLNQRLNCFNSVPTNSATSYKVTIHVHSAVQEYPLSEFNVVKGGPGHAYITLEKTNGTHHQQLSFGFYPQEDTWVTPTKNAVASGIGEESSDPERRSDIRMTKSINNLEFTAAVVNASNNSTKTYDLNDYNCTDFAIDVFNASQSGVGKLNVLNSSIGFTTPVGLYKALDNLRIGGNANVSNVSTKAPVSTNCN